MEQLYPLRTCIINHNIIETSALTFNIEQFPNFFSIRRVTGDIRDSFQILSAETFDVTICNDRTIPIDTIFKIGQQRFGILVFLDKDASMKANNHPQAKGNSFYIQPPYKASLVDLIGSISAEFAERKLIEQVTELVLQKHFVITDANKTTRLRQQQILYVRSKGGYCDMKYLDINGLNKKSLRANLPYFIVKLPSLFFFQTDRNHYVNLLYLREIDKAQNTITLESEQWKWREKIPISERGLTELRRRRPDLFS